jgi:hypothetical protein
LNRKIWIVVFGAVAAALLAIFNPHIRSIQELIACGLLYFVPFLLLWVGIVQQQKNRAWGKIPIVLGSALLLCYGMTFAYVKWLGIESETEVSAWECLGNLYADVGVGSGRSYQRQLRVTLSIPVLEGNESKVPRGFTQITESGSLWWVGHQDTFEPYAVFAWSGPVSVYDVRRQIGVRWRTDSSWFERSKKIWPSTGSQGCS